MNKDFPGYLKNIKPVFSDEKKGVWIYHTDCIQFMDRLIKEYPDGLFDMIFADPPYFLSNDGITCKSGKMTSVNKGEWDRSKGFNENYKFTKEWLSRCQRLLKTNGTIWISGTHHIIFIIGYVIQEIGMKILNDIIWEKPNPPPNLSCRYFTHSTETIIWAAKNYKSKHIFNYEYVKKINNGKQMKSVWKIEAPKEDEKKYGKHPTQKPLKLLERIVLSSTLENDLIFDPFLGSGTTAVAALKNKRRFIGCEIEKNYIEISIKRIEDLIYKSVEKISLFGD